MNKPNMDAGSDILIEYLIHTETTIVLGQNPDTEKYFVQINNNYYHGTNLHAALVLAVFGF